MIEAYQRHVEERQQLGLPPKPLTPVEVEQLCTLLTSSPREQDTFLVHLLRDRVAPGVDPAAKVKADFLGAVVTGRLHSPLLNAELALELLSTMLGGYNLDPLLTALRNPALAAKAAEALTGTTLMFDKFELVRQLASENPHARKVLEAWAEGSWFLRRPALANSIKLKVFRVDGEVNTDDFSPAGEAWSRPDIPLHAQCMGEKRFPGGLAKIAGMRLEGFKVAFVADVVGTGSSRKSACNSLLWHIGEDIPAVPNKRRGGIILGGQIAPIFFNTAQDSGGLPIRCDVSRLKMGQVIRLEPAAGRIVEDSSGEVLARFELKPITLADEFRAGGRVPLIIGRALTERARKALGQGPASCFAKVENPAPAPGQGFTLAQKLVGKACGLPGVLPGTSCEPRMTTVGSQDTTGMMTADELKELACLAFQAPLYMQSFCHTAAYPKPADIAMHNSLPAFVTERGGVALRPGDGVIHSWLNRLLLPDTVGTGGDSHTRFPIGISFPAGSGLIAFAGALGFMPLDMPESVLVRFKGKLQPGITLRDVVNAIPLEAIRRGLLTVPKAGKINCFNGRILEMEGLSELSVEQAFELTDASAERSAAAACIRLEVGAVAAYLRSNV
ncbi:MAG: aconitate hydratase B, partial [Deltaproteobacteria bacterium RIFOXYA12_FULL_61_11]